MILLTHETPILLCVAPADFRRGIDGFVAQCKNDLAQDPRSGCVFVFINKARTMIRALSYDGNGFWLMTKRLSKGKFQAWPVEQASVCAKTARELRLILSGNVCSPTGLPSDVKVICEKRFPSAQSSSTMFHP